jgi:hypothetical protein
MRKQSLLKYKGKIKRKEMYPYVLDAKSEALCTAET